MIRKQSIIPDFVFYIDFYDCTIADALLSELKRWELTLPMIGNIRVNWHRLLGSYGKNIQNLRRLWYKIETIIKHNEWHTETKYLLKNPNFNHSENARYQGHEMHS